MDTGAPSLRIDTRVVRLLSQPFITRHRVLAQRPCQPCREPYAAAAGIARSPGWADEIHTSALVSVDI